MSARSTTERLAGPQRRARQRPRAGSVLDRLLRLLQRSHEMSLDALGSLRGAHVIVVGGGGRVYRSLIARGARLTGVESDPDGRAGAERRIASLPPWASIVLDPNPYGRAPSPLGPADIVLFPWSLAGRTDVARLLAVAHGDLAPGGLVAAVDFLAARGPAALLLHACGSAADSQLPLLLRRSFPNCELELQRGPLCESFVFTGRAGDFSPA